jgi:hypothetical protein
MRTYELISGRGMRFFFFVKASRLVVGPTQPPILVDARSSSAGSTVVGA